MFPSPQWVQVCVEGPKAKAQPSIPNPATEEDNRPKVLIRGEWHKVPDAYPKDAFGHVERDQRFINELAKQLVAELQVACELNASDTKVDLIYKPAFCDYL